MGLLSSLARFGFGLGNKIQRFANAQENAQRKQELQKNAIANKQKLAKQKEMQKQALQNERFRKKINTGLAKKSPLPTTPKINVSKPAPVDVGAKMKQFKAKQSQGLKNPVNLDNKIKNIMGVN